MIKGLVAINGQFRVLALTATPGDDLKVCLHGYVVFAALDVILYLCPVTFSAHSLLCLPFHL